MSKAERLKEEIGWLKVVFAVCVALDASLVAWLAQNYATAEPVLVTTGCIASILLALLVVFVNRRAYWGPVEQPPKVFVLENLFKIPI